MTCRVVPGRLKQIDAGAGQVVGVSDNNLIYSLQHDEWNRLPGVLKHVSVGSAGIWGVNPGDEIFKLVSGKWTKVPGFLKQIDAGGDQIISGVNSADQIFCLGKDATVGFKGAGSPTPWQHIPGGLKYYSCGPISCWGVNVHNSVFIMKGVSSARCGGTMSWTHVPGSLSMIEVGSDGSVYGVNSAGYIYRRPGSKNVKPDALSRQFASDSPLDQDEPILPPHCLVAAAQLDIETIVQQSLAQDPGPGEGGICSICSGLHSPLSQDMGTGQASLTEGIAVTTSCLESSFSSHQGSTST
ncbi:fish-egg lectin-like [Sardina pilchardus]|uniref:fish-egg lectin-like n=1 Tax=Sardina pilchardus TaxID=27697 RepID=UPI002E15C264